MNYRIEERVGCIAVVDESFKNDRLHPDMEGVIAYWQGKYTFGWQVADWQILKAYRLCNLLNGLKRDVPSSMVKSSHLGDPCIFCQTPHDDVSIGDCPSRLSK